MCIFAALNYKNNTIMKKLFYLLLVVIGVSVSVAACDSENTDKNENTLKKFEKGHPLRPAVNYPVRRDTLTAQYNGTTFAGVSLLLISVA